MKLLNRKSSTKRIPNTVEWKMSEYDRLYAASNSPGSGNGNGNTTKSKFMKKSLSSSVKRGMKSSSSKKTEEAEQSMSISVNGKPLLEIHPGAKMEDVQTFLNSLQQDISVKVEAVKAEVNDDSNFNSVGDRVVAVVDDYEEKLGKSFRDLKMKLNEEGYDEAYTESVGKSFRDLQANIEEGITKSRKDADEAASKAVTSAADATNAVLDTVEKKKNETVVATNAALDAVEKKKMETMETVEGSRRSMMSMGRSVRSFFGKQQGGGDAASKKTDEATVASEEETAVEAPVAPAVVEEKASSRPSTPKEEVKASSRPSTPKETEVKASSRPSTPKEAEAAPEKQEADAASVQSKDIAAAPIAKEEAPAAATTEPAKVEEPKVEPAKAEEVDFNVRVRSGLAAVEHGIHDAAIAIQPSIDLAVDYAAPRVDQGREQLSLAAGSFAESVSTAVAAADKKWKEHKGLSPGSTSPRSAISEEDNLEPNIEAVEQNNQILLGFYDPALGKEEVKEEEEKGIDLSDVSYNLSLMVDGAVVQTMALSAAAMEVFTCCVSEAKKTAGVQDSKNDLEDDSSAVDEAECTKGRISPLVFPNDLSKNEETEEVNPTNNASEKEPEEGGLVHPFIADKMSEFLGQAKASFEQLPTTAAPAAADASVVSQSAVSQQSWFDASGLTKSVSERMGAYLTPPSSPVEEARNDEAAANNPAVAQNLEVRV